MSGLWSSVYRYFGGNAFSMEVVGSNIVTVGVFWFWCSLLAVVDMTGQPRWMLKYKMQPGKNQPVEPHRILDAIRVAVFNQLFCSVPFSILLFWIRTKQGAPYQPNDLPSTLLILRDLTVFIVVEEIGFYYTHRLVHWGPLYRSIHKKHHEWTAPVGVVAVYAHPVEYMLSNVLPFVAGPLLMNSHLATTWIWYTIAVTTTIIHHSGYHLPMLPSSEFHDYHHLKFTGNYGVLGWLDYLHGTDLQFRKSIQFKRDRLFLGLTPVSILYPDK